MRHNAIYTCHLIDSNVLMFVVFCCLFYVSKRHTHTIKLGQMCYAKLRKMQENYKYSIHYAITIDIT